MTAPASLSGLESVGPSILRDLERLGIRSVAGLARRNPQRMYEQLCARDGPVDICVYDVFCAAVAQALDPQLPAERRKWWYWSRLRKASDVQA